MSKVYRPSLVSRSFVHESKLSHNGRDSNGFASETLTSLEEKTSRYALKYIVRLLPYKRQISINE